MPPGVFSKLTKAKAMAAINAWSQFAVDSDFAQLYPSQMDPYLLALVSAAVVYEFNTFGDVKPMTFWVVKFNGMSAKLIAEDQRTAFKFLREHTGNGAQISDMRMSHLASRIAVKHDDEAPLECIKNRYGAKLSAEVKDLEDLSIPSAAKMFCAIRGWNDPLSISEACLGDYQISA